MRFIDSHVHLCEYQDHGWVLNMARSSETMILSSGIDKETSLMTLETAKNERAIVRPFVGTHPSEAKRATNLDWFESAVREASGVGEIGLDPSYSEVAPDSTQWKTFVSQLESAERAEKPIQVHSRGAEEKCLEILEGYRLNKVLMHWFESESSLSQVESRGYFTSFGPALLYSKKLQRMASRLDPALVLTESDGPVTFRPLGGAEGPSLIPTVVFKLGELWRLTFSEAEERVLVNGIKYLGEKT